RSFYSANGSRVFVTLCNLKAKDETILSPAAEYRKCHSPLARENFGDFPGSRKTRVINFVVLPTLGGKRPSAVGESSPAIIRPQTTPAVMTKYNLSETTVRRRTRSSGEELPERPPAKQQRYPDSGSEDGPGGGDSSGGQFSDGKPVNDVFLYFFIFAQITLEVRDGLLQFHDSPLLFRNFVSSFNQSLLLPSERFFLIDPLEKPTIKIYISSPATHIGFITLSLSLSLIARSATEFHISSQLENNNEHQKKTEIELGKRILGINVNGKIPSMSTSSSSDGASYVDMLYAVNDSNFGIPDRCPCGSAIIIRISTEAAAIPKKYFVSKDLKNDRLHRKQEWTAAIEDETRRLKKTVDDHESRIRSLGRVEYRIDRIYEDAQKNDGEIANLGYQIHEMEKVLKKNTEEIALLKKIIEKL
ncbi:unnamed protein product, partial [Brassica rapa subsp. narinosa]